MDTDNSSEYFRLAWLKGGEVFAGGKDIGISVIIDHKSVLVVKNEHP